MIESLDELERELMALKPRPASAQLGQRIEAEIGAPITLGRWYAPLAVAASIAVAALLLTLFTPAPTDRTNGTSTLHANGSIPAIDSTVPTLIAYHRALAQSEADLAALLDAHAAASHAQPASNAAPSPESPLRWRDDSMLDQPPNHEKPT